MSKFESGDNAATTADAQTELADGFGIPRETLANYLDGVLELDEVVDWIQHGAPEPVVSKEGDFRYDGLRRVLESKRFRERWSPPAIAAAKSLQLDADEDPDERWWVETLDRLDAAIKVSIPKVPPRSGSPLDFDEVPALRTARKKR